MIESILIIAMTNHFRHFKYPNQQKQTNISLSNLVIIKKKLSLTLKHRSVWIGHIWGGGAFILISDILCPAPFIMNNHLLLLAVLSPSHL